MRAGTGTSSIFLTIARLIAPTAAGVLLTGAAACLAVWALDAAVIKGWLDGLAADGTADEFPPARVAAMQWRALWAAAGAGLLAGGVWRGRDAIARLGEAGMAAAGRAWGWSAREMRPMAPALAAVTLVGAVLRGLYLQQPMRTDEATTYLEFVSQPLYFGVSFYPVPNNHLLHTVVAHGLVSLFGGEPWAIRLAAFLAGVAMIPAAAVAALVVTGRAAALPAACLVAVAWPWVFYSANARGYTMLGLLFLALIAIGARLRQERDTGAWLWFVLCAGLGLFTVPVMAYALVPLGLWVVAGRREAWRELAVAAVGTAALAGALYAPALAVSGLRAMTPEMAASGGAVWPRIVTFGGALWANWHQDVPVWAGWGVAAVAAAGWRGGSLAAIAGGWFLAALAAWPVMPYTRVWLWLSLPWLLLVAGGAGRLLPRGRWATAALLALTAAQGGRIAHSGSIGRSYETGGYPGAAEAVAVMRPLWRAGDGMETDASLPALQYEARRQGLPVSAGAGAKRVWVVAVAAPAGAGNPVGRVGRRGIWLVEKAPGLH